MKYFLLTDNSVQWFTYLISCKESDKNKAIDIYEIEKTIDNSFLRNIFRRDPNYYNIEIENVGPCKSFTAWSISEFDFRRIQDMISLFPYHKKFLELGELK